MKEIEYKILDLFKKNPEKEFSTTDIVTKVFKEEFNENTSDFKIKTDISKEKSKKAKLHRRILYHLKKLVDDNIIIVTKQGNKGQKFFILNVENGKEIIIDRKSKKIILSKPDLPLISIEGYEKQKIIYMFEKNNWINRLNAVLVMANRYDNINELYDNINSLFFEVNDVIGLYGFNQIIEKSTIHDIVFFLEKTNSDCIDYNRKLSIIININKRTPLRKLLSTLTYYSYEMSKNINIIFETTNKELIEYTFFFEKIVSMFKERHIRLYIKNKNIYKSPYIIGNAGPYTINEKEWLDYKADIKATKIIVLSQTTIIIDIKRFFEEYNGPKKFREFIISIAKSLLKTNSFQRKKADVYFKRVIEISKENAKTAFNFGKNYIRFWNYGWKSTSINQEFLIDLIKSAKEEVDKFTNAEEIIYKSCGMPTRFKIAFSCEFNIKEYDLSREEFMHIKIKKISDLYSEKMLEYLKAKEKIFNIFDGGDIINFYKISLADAEEMVREINILLTSYYLPLMGFDLTKTAEKEVKLTSFLK